MENELTLAVKTKGAEDAAAKVKLVNDRVAETGKESESIKDKLGKAALAITAVGVGLTAYSLGATNSAIAYTKSVTAISRVTGESVTETSRLQYAFQRSGIAADQTTQIFGIFSKKIVDANTNADRASTTLGKLDIATKNADGSTRGFSSVLLDVADRFKTMANGPEKSALAMDLFGKSGKALIPVLSKGSDGIKELEAQADKLGITLTTKNIDAVAKYTAAQQKLKDSQTAFTLSVGQTALPMWQKLADAQVAAVGIMQRLPQPVQAATTAVLAFGGPVLTAAGTLVGFGANLSQVTGKSLPAMMSQIPILGGLLSKLSLSFGSLGSLLANPIVLAVLAVVAAVALLLTHFNQWGPIVAGVQASVQGFWASLMVVLKPAIDSIQASIIQLMPVFIAMGPPLQFLAEIIGKILVVAIWLFVGVLAAAVAAAAWFVAAVLNTFVAWKNGVINVINTIKNILNIVSFFSWLIGVFADSGGAMIDAFGRGIASRFGKVKDIVSQGLAAVRRLLPFSDAKEGPLSTLTLSGQRFAETFATGIDRGAGAIDTAATNALSGLGGGTIGATVSGSSPAGGPSISPGKQITNQFYGNITLGNVDAVKEFFKQINENAELASLGVPTSV